MKDFKTKQRREKSFFLASAMALFLFYYSYRYIFQYNSEVTSPSYSNTPPAFQMAKYIILLAICLMIFVSIQRSTVDPCPKSLYILIFLMMVHSVYAYIWTGSANSITFTICMVPALLMLFVSDDIDLSPFDKLVKIFLYFTLAYEALQWILYVLEGRLPALGYDTGEFTDVRFGGAWDDPNGYAVLLGFFIPYVFVKYKGGKRFVLMTLLIVSLILTWSLTGIASILGAGIVWVAVKIFNGTVRFTKKRVIAIVVAMVATVVIIVLGLSIFQDQIVYFISRKLGSVEAHIKSLDIDFNFLIAMGITPTAEFSESGVLMLVTNGGIFHAVTFYIVGIWGIVLAYRSMQVHANDRRVMPFLVAGTVYQIDFLLANLNLPLLYQFSNLGIYMVLLIIFVKYANPKTLPADSKNKVPFLDDRCASPTLKEGSE